MLRITPSNSTAGAKRYFDEALIRGDYYIEGQELAGQWGGQGAERLGLAGEVTRGAFRDLCENLNPATGSRLTARTREGRRVGYDFTFNCPKHVSTVWALTRDDRILSAFRDSVRETMQELEHETECRVRDHGQFDSRTTGNMVWGEFVHFTSRPENGTPDPHLHAHCFAFNATWDAEHQNRNGTYGMWKAGDFGSIKRDARYYEAAFHSRFSGRLAQMGFEVARDGRGFWDLAGIPESVKDKFSRRTARIEALAKELGITDPEGKAQLGKRSAQVKAKNRTMNDLRSVWKSWLTPAERRAIQKASAGAGGSPRAASVSAADCLEHAIHHVFERRSVVSERQLADRSLRRGLGVVSVADVWRRMEALSDSGAILTAERDRQTLVTTRQVLAEERAMLQFAREGRGASPTLGSPGYRFRDPLFSNPTTDTTEQELAIRKVLSSHDRVIAVRGGAGTGKTTLMNEVVRGIEESGHQIHVFAPTAEASRGVLRDAGFAEADTVAQLLQNRKMQERVRGQVIWIDEAGLLGAQTLNRVFQIAEARGSRVILTGDTKQHAPVDRGDALRILETHGGVAPVEITKIQRQRARSGPEPEDITRYRQAVKLLSEGQPRQGFALLQQMNAVTEFDIDQGLKVRCDQIAADYVASLADRNLRGGRNTVLAISPTHAEGEAVTRGIRSGLRMNGSLAPDDHHVTRLIPSGRTEAERQDPATYSPGEVIQLHQHIPGGFRRGERYRVLKVAGDRVEIESPENGPKLLPLEYAKRFSVYQPGTLPVASGDRVRITKNGFAQDRKHRLNNGTIYEVRSVHDDGAVELANGWKLAPDFGHLTHGYVTTSHAAQGKNVDVVLIAQSAQSFGASSLEQFYVSASRAKEQVRIYTDDREGLQDAIARSSQRIAATELVPEKLLAERHRQQRLVERRRLHRYHLVRERSSSTVRRTGYEPRLDRR